MTNQDKPELSTEEISAYENEIQLEVDDVLKKYNSLAIQVGWKVIVAFIMTQEELNAEMEKGTFDVQGQE